MSFINWRAIGAVALPLVGGSLSGYLGRSPSKDWYEVSHYNIAFSKMSLIQRGAVRSSVSGVLSLVSQSVRLRRISFTGWYLR